MQSQSHEPGKNPDDAAFERAKLAHLCRNSILRIEYENYKFDLRAELPSRWLRVLHKGYKVETSAFITAYHPDFQQFDVHHDRARHHWLQCKVERQWTYLQATGCGPDSGIDRNNPCPVEPQLLVLGITLEEALALGAEHGQPSILFSQADGVPRFYHCGSGECLSPPDEEREEYITLNNIDLDYRPSTYWLSALTPYQFVQQMPCRGLQEEAKEAMLYGGLHGLLEFIAELKSKYATDPCAFAAKTIAVDFTFPPAHATAKVSIASFGLRSVHGEAISINAQWDGAHIRYSIANDFDLEFELAFTESKRPLTLKELIGLIDGSDIPDDIYAGRGLVYGNWDAGLEEDGCLEKALQFISIDSDYYPQLGDYYAAAAEQWIVEKLF